MPLPYYLCFVAVFLLGSVAWQGRWKGWGLPMGATLATVATWYLGDAIYNDYEVYRSHFSDGLLASAWWQVLLFLIAFGFLTPSMHSLINGRLLGRGSFVMAYLERHHFHHPEVQQRINQFASALFAAWGILMLVALLRVKGDIFGLFAPYLGQKANPWARGQIGGGLSALISFGNYLQIFLVSACGVVAALSKDRRTLSIALLICLLAMPPYIFDRTRSTMLAVVMPGFLTWILVRVRAGWATKLGLLGLAFLVINFWLTVVMANREGMSFDIIGALESVRGTEEVNARHEGLNMYEELAWINYLMEAGYYEPNLGERYFAELVNPIPRGLWRGKPTIGLDYAIARGQGVVGAQGETTSTKSTGMVGQGVVNFGRFFGPIAAALLMALWTALLARQDLLGESPARLVLFLIGMMLTFNLGRDITLLVLYPFFFGLLLFFLWQRFLQGRGAPQTFQGSSREEAPFGDS